jgi:C-terminal processing protease CtpA/Prc
MGTISTSFTRPRRVIIAIDGKNLHSLDRAAKLSEKVGSGTKLTVIKADGGRLLIEVD